METPCIATDYPPVNRKLNGEDQRHPFVQSSAHAQALCGRGKDKVPCALLRNSGGDYAANKKIGDQIQMANIFSDQEIDSLINENKPLPTDYRAKIQVRPKRGHKEQELNFIGKNGNDFRVILRQSTMNPLDFSIILALSPAQSNILFRLRRYNGKSHEHTNQIENETFYDYHIHQATERYQQMGAREDSYAERTDRFSDFHQAISCLIKDCGFEIPAGTQRSLFEEI